MQEKQGWEKQKREFVCYTERRGERIPEKRPKLKVLLESFSVVLPSTPSLPLESLSSAAANEDARGDSSLSSPGSSTIEHRKGIGLPTGA